MMHHQPQPRAPERVVVMGATGFVGADLARHLREQGVETVALGSADVDLLRPDAAEALRQIVRPGDALVFVSALTPDKGRDIATFMKNLRMGEAVSAALSRAPLSHVVYVSSDTVYDDAANPLRESTRCAPGSFHGLMHLARERMLAFAAQPRQIPLFLVRPCLIYGAGDTHNGYGPNRFLRSASQERRIALFGQGEEQRDHIYVKDLSRLIALGLWHRSDGALNGATGRSVSFGDLARFIAGIAPHEVRIEPSPRATPVTHRHFDITELIRTFPSFRFTPLRDGLLESLPAEAAIHG